MVNSVLIGIKPVGTQLNFNVEWSYNKITRRPVGSTDKKEGEKNRIC